VDVQIATPTYARDLANVILKALPKLDNNEVKVFHFSNEGVCS
jgi:dTDP-4-dehydrorhamnose reductase